MVVLGGTQAAPGIYRQPVHMEAAFSAGVHDFLHGAGLILRYLTSRRGGRADECGGLENRCPGLTGTVGSNPTPSAQFRPSCSASPMMMPSGPRRKQSR